jgi:hypothetical protein
MAKWLGITWTDVHSSKKNPQPHRDVISRSSDKAKGQKIGHSNDYSGSKSSGSGVRNLAEAEKANKISTRTNLLKEVFTTSFLLSIITIWDN